MRLQTNKISMSGFGRIRDVLMKTKLSKIELPAEDLKIALAQEIEFGKCCSLWYGGLIAEISAGNSKCSLMANGDVRAYLTDKQTDEEIVYVKDKSNSGTFGSEMSQYIKDDTQLQLLIDNEDPKYSLELTDNNWYEAFFERINGDYSDESVVCDSDNVFDAIVDAVEMMKYFIKEKE